MKWFASYRPSPTEDSTALQLVKVNLPRLTRPNLVARLYMLFTAMSTAGIGWGIPTSATAKIMESGGVMAHVIVATIAWAVAIGLLDVIANDVLVLRSRTPTDGLIGRAAALLENNRTGRCFLIGGCYLVLTFATHSSPVGGTFWLLLYYMQMTLCAGLLGWSLRALMLATFAEEGRDAVT